MQKLILAILAVALTPLAAWGEKAEDSWENLKQLKAGHKIKLEDMDLKVWDGRLVKVSDEAITIREKQKQQEITVERAKVFRVRDLQRSRRGLNAVIGFAAGALLYAAFRRDYSDSAEHAIAIGFVGGIGAGIGAAIPDPRPAIYRANQKPQRAGSDHQR